MDTSKYLLLFFLTTLLLLPSPTTASPNITAIFAFGDSILDPGNNNRLSTIFRSDHPPYGIDFPGRVPSGRFSDGKLATDFLVSQLGIKELLPAYLDPALTDRDLLTGASFASAGTGLDDLTASEANVLTLNAQLRNFMQALQRMRSIAGQQEADRVVENALFMVAAGTNDMLYNFYGLPLRRTYSLSGYQDLLLQNLENVIRTLHSTGARRVAVVGLPPIGCMPVSVTLGSLVPSFHMLQRVCVDQQNSDSEAYNAKLKALTSRLQATLPGSRVVYVDVYTPIMDMVISPAAFGLEKTTEGCCGLGSVEMGPVQCACSKVPRSIQVPILGCCSSHTINLLVSCQQIPTRTSSLPPRLNH
ncbi:UNVERIFIED_CONTAM: GDSL esterase/lipase [Sesamum calycinum]|uniref:GDSL esterase/lipase n=1 Tax=Sesamum calycinum TaxID=2727403 RepID=A0AAW2LTK0_9LAMI